MEKQNFKEIKETLNNLMETNYEDFIKALVSIETGINDEVVLNNMYEDYMSEDNVELLNDRIIGSED